MLTGSNRCTEDSFPGSLFSEPSGHVCCLAMKMKLVSFVCLKQRIEKKENRIV